LSAEHHHPALAHHFDSLEQQQSAATLGMWTFLVTEVMIFGAILMAYAVYRTAYTAEFEAASGHLILGLGAANTLVLIGSSLAMALAVRAAQLGQNRATVSFLLLTILLGTVFLGVKAYEWHDEYTHHLVPLPGLPFEQHWEADGKPLSMYHVKLFFCFYFILTGLHALHMIIGVGILGMLIMKARRGDFSTEYSTPVDIGGLYWHFVDIVWIFLFPLLYLVGTRTEIW
jgi:cytochrome c oxidase subunit III